MTDTNEIQGTIVYVLVIYVPLNQKSEGRDDFLLDAQKLSQEEINNLNKSVAHSWIEALIKIFSNPKTSKSKWIHC